MNFVAIGAGAGLVSALLIAVVTRGTGLALVLFLLAPIPVLIASLGWDHRAGLVAALTGAIATAIVASPLGGLSFALATALPAWWLAYLAMLGRTHQDGSVEWYPTGNLLAWIAGMAALSYVIAAVIPDFDFQAYQAMSREAAELVLRVQTGTPEGAVIPPFGDIAAETVIERLAAATPIFAAQGFTIVLILYLWVSAKVVSTSGRLVRPWPYIPATQMPRNTLLVLAVAALAATIAGGFVGVLGLALTGAFIMAFGIQGLAALHDMTRGRSGRMFILILAYLLIFLSQGLVLLALVLFGIADSALSIRQRMGARINGPKGPPTKRS
jgi:hypothetical protein